MSPKGQQKPANKVAENGQRDGSGRFVAGHKSAGGGRPAVAAEHRKRMQTFMDEEGLALLLADARRPGKPGFAARELVMAYAYGKPSQKVDLGTAEGPLRVIVEYVTTPNGG